MLMKIHDYHSLSTFLCVVGGAGSCADLRLCHKRKQTYGDDKTQQSRRKRKPGCQCFGERRSWESPNFDSSERTVTTPARSPSLLPNHLARSPTDLPLAQPTTRSPSPLTRCRPTTNTTASRRRTRPPRSAECPSGKSPRATCRSSTGGSPRTRGSTRRRPRRGSGSRSSSSCSSCSGPGSSCA